MARSQKQNEILTEKTPAGCQAANGSAMLALARRGFDTEISFYSDPGLEIPARETCRACVDICPMAAPRPKPAV